MLAESSGSIQFCRFSPDRLPALIVLSEQEILPAYSLPQPPKLNRAKMLVELKVVQPFLALSSAIQSRY